MVKVTLREGETFDGLLKRFKTATKKADILIEVRKREFFLKKSLKRKQKAKFAKIKERNR